MEIGGFFILVLLVVVLVVVGGGLYALSMWLRGRKLSPRGDEIEGRREERSRPEHLAVESDEQRSHFVGSRR